MAMLSKNRSIHAGNPEKTDYLAHATGDVSIRMTNDYLFKALLQKNNRVLRALIAALLHKPTEEVLDVVITNPIMLGDYVEEKMISLDVRVTFNAGECINLEMQVVNEKNWVERSLYYACRNYTSLETGDSYDQIRPVYQIGLLDFSLFPEEPAFYSIYRLLNEKTHSPYTDRFMIGVLDLTHIDLASKEDKRYNIHGWARLFKAQTWEEIKVIAKQDVNIQDAAETIYQLTESERIRQQCEAREDYIRRMNGWAGREKEHLAIIADQNRQLAEKDEQLNVKDEQLAEKDEQLAEKDCLIAELQARLTSQEESS